MFKASCASCEIEIEDPETMVTIDVPGEFESNGEGEDPDTNIRHVKRWHICREECWPMIRRVIYS